MRIGKKTEEKPASAPLGEPVDRQAPAGEEASVDGVMK